MQKIGQKPFAMTENVLSRPLYYSETTNPEGEVMETLEARVRHFQQNSKNTGKDGFVVYEKYHDAKWQRFRVIIAASQPNCRDKNERSLRIISRKKPKQKGSAMMEKEKNILTQELWTLVSLGFDATKHDLEIMEKIIKCVSKEDSREMTPYKRKVVEELQLEWHFLKSLHGDLAAIATRLGKSEVVPAVPDLDINNEIWKVGPSGASDALYETSDKISDFQSALQDCAFQLQEVCS